VDSVVATVDSVVAGAAVVKGDSEVVDAAVAVVVEVVGSAADKVEEEDVTSVC
jgi:hypothetical protein